MAPKRKRKKSGTTIRKKTGRKTASKKKAGGKKTSRKKAARKTSSRKYSPRASEYVREEMEEFKAGKARSGRSGQKVKSREQAIAIGLSEARRAGAKAPENPNDDRR